MVLTVRWREREIWQQIDLEKEREGDGVQSCQQKNELERGIKEESECKLKEGRTEKKHGSGEIRIQGAKGQARENQGTSKDIKDGEREPEARERLRQ